MSTIFGGCSALTCLRYAVFDADLGERRSKGVLKLRPTLKRTASIAAPTFISIRTMRAKAGINTRIGQLPKN
jgi:hypothetical protein